MWRRASAGSFATTRCGARRGAACARRRGSAAEVAVAGGAPIEAVLGDERDLLRHEQPRRLGVGSGRTPAAAPRRAIVRRRRRVVRPPGVALRAPDRAEARRRVRALVFGGAGLAEQHAHPLPTVERALAQLVQVSVDDEHRDHRRPVRTARSHGRPVEHARHDVGAAQRIALLAVQAADEAQELRGDRCVAVARRAADHHLKDLVLCHSLPHFRGVFRKPRVRHAVLANELEDVVVVIHRSDCARNSLVDCSGERCGSTSTQAGVTCRSR